VLTFFRTNQVFSSIILIFYIALLRFSVFLAPFKWNPSGQGVFSDWVYGWAGSQEVTSHALAILLLLVQGFLLNLLTINNRLSNEVNLFPGVFYVLFCSLMPDFLYLSPVLLGNTFFILAMVNLFDTYKNPACADRIFNAGLLTGVASLFYFPFVFCFIVLMAGLNILRAFNIQERLMAIIGMFIPYFLTGLYFFWFDRLGFFWERQVVGNMGFLSFGEGLPGWEQYFKLFIFAVAVLYGILNNNEYLAKKNIQVQKKISILYWVLVSAGVAALFQSNLTFEHLMMLAPPLGIFFGLSFTAMRPQWAESIHFLMVVGALTMQFFPWLL
jgi:hypothetical protein